MFQPCFFFPSPCGDGLSASFDWNSFFRVYAQSLKVKTFTVYTLMYVAVLADTLLASGKTVVYANKESDVEVNSERNHRLDLLSVFVCHRVNGIKNHAQSLFMAVGFAKRRSSVFVKTYVRFSSTKDCHVSKSDTKKTIVCYTRQRRLQKGDSSSVGVKINNFKVSFVLSHPMHEINSIACKHYKT